MAGWSSVKSNSFYFTLYNPSRHEEDLILHTRHATYVTVRRFKSVMATDHLQGYVVLNTPTDVANVRTYWGFERCFITPTEKNLMFNSIFREFGECKELGKLTGELHPLPDHERHMVMSTNVMEAAILRPLQVSVMDILDKQDDMTITFEVAHGLEGQTFLSWYIEDMRSAFRWQNPISYKECMEKYQGEKYAAIDVYRCDTKVFNYNIIHDLKDMGCKTVVFLADDPDRHHLVEYMQGDYNTDIIHVTNGTVNMAKSWKLYTDVLE